MVNAIQPKLQIRVRSALTPLKLDLRLGFLTRSDQGVRVLLLNFPNYGNQLEPCSLKRFFV